MRLSLWSALENCGACTFPGTNDSILIWTPAKQLYTIIADAHTYFEVLLGARVIFRRDPRRPAPSPAEAWPSLGQAAGPPVILPTLLPATPPCPHLPPGLAIPRKICSGGSWAGLGGNMPPPLNFPTKFPTEFQCQKRAPR